MGIAFLDQPSHWDDNKPTYDSYIKQQEPITARRVAELDKKKELDMVIPQHRAERMDDGLQGDVPVEELMDGMRGFL
jgi:hypothetical protein